MVGQFDERIGKITHNTDEFELVDEKDAQTHFDRRAWSYKLKPMPTKRTPRIDVQDSTLTNRKTMVWDTFDKGVSGELENRYGALYMAEGCNGMVPGALRAGSNISLASSNDEPCEPMPPLVFSSRASLPSDKGPLLTFHGRYVLSYGNGASATDKDFGTGSIATCAIMHNNACVVGFTDYSAGGAGPSSATKIWSRANTGVWTQAGDNTYADHFARTTNRLWRATSVNQVSNIAATDNPLTLANWSSGITVGDPTTGVTALLTVGERLYVCKPEGMFAGDTNAIFPNVLDNFINQVHHDNGKRAIAIGGTIFYPHVGGLLRYDTTSEQAEEIGIQLQVASASTEKAPGTLIRGLAADGQYIWAATGPSGYPRANPLYVKKTTDNGSSYSNLLTNTIDNDMSTTGSIGALDTVANGDWLLIGYSTAFAGILLEFVAPNDGTSTKLTVDFSSSGGGFNAITMSAIDQTSQATLTTPTVPGPTMSTSGYIFWPQNGTSSANSWAATTVDSVSAFWVRLKMSVVLDAAVTIGEIRVLLSEYGSSQIGWLYRGRPARRSDGVEQSIVWEPYDVIGDGITPCGVTMTSGVYPHRRGKTLVVSSFAADNFYHTQGSWTLFETGPQNNARVSGNLPPRATSCRHDGGTPNVKKQFHSITVQGKGIDSVRDIKLDYRTDFSTTWTEASASITSSPTIVALSGVTGYFIQWRITFNAYTATSEQATEINLVECDYVEIPASRKREWQYLINLTPSDIDDPLVLLTLLEGYLDDAAATHIDPLRRSATANVIDVGVAELYYSTNGKEGYAVPVVIGEV